MKIYRIGIVGHTAAGKTSILLSLAMNRNPQLSEMSGAAIPLTAKRLKSADGEALKAGYDWIDKAKRKMRSGEPVDANAILTDDLMIEYEVSREGGDPYRVRLFDYSGELMGTKMQENELAAYLIGKFNTDLDGILVVMPAEQRDDVLEQLGELSQTFNLISDNTKGEGNKLSLPVALAVTKWDLLGGMGSYSRELERIETVITSGKFPMHHSLYKSLNNTTLDDDLLLTPMSAFGPCDQQRSTDGRSYSTPKIVNPLNALGVLEPLVWICEHAQRKSFETLQNEIEALRAQTLWARLFSPLAARRTQTQIKQNLWRFSQESEEFQQLKRWRRTAGWLHVVSMLLIMATLGALGLIVEFGVDQRRGRQATADIAQSDAGWEAIEISHKWLQSYIRSPAYQHMLYKIAFSRSEAQKLADKYSKDLDAKLCKSLSSETDLGAQLNKIDMYIKDFPNGSCFHEAHVKRRAVSCQIERNIWWVPYQPADLETRVAILKAYLKREQSSACKDVTDEVTQRLKNDLGEIDTKSWEPVLAALTQDAKRDAITKYLGDHPRGKYSEQAHKWIAELDSQKEWAGFSRDYNEALKVSVDQAYQRLKSKEVSDGHSQRFKALSESFAEQAYQSLLNEATQKLNMGYYDDAVKLMRSYLSFEERYTKESLRVEAQKLVKQFRDTYDQALYNRLVSEPSESNCNDYLIRSQSGSIPGVMSQYVEPRITYIQGLQHGQFKLTASERAATNKCDIFRNSTRFSVSGVNNSSQAVLGYSLTFAAPRDQQMTISFTLHADGYFSNPKQYGSLSLTVEELLSYPRSLELRCFDDDNQYFKVEFILEEIGREAPPPLPPWEHQ